MTAPTPSLREAAAMALDALERNVQHKYPCEPDEAVRRGQASIEALRAALAVPDEPVAYVDYDQPNNIAWCPSATGLRDILPLYATPQPAPAERQPLTDGKIDCVTIEQWGEMRGYPLSAHRAYARAIEATHGIGAA